MGQWVVKWKALLRLQQRFVGDNFPLQEEERPHLAVWSCGTKNRKCHSESTVVARPLWPDHWFFLGGGGGGVLLGGHHIHTFSTHHQH